MKKGFQFLIAFAALFVGIRFVEAKDYQLDLIKNSIELNVDTLEEVKQQAIDGTIYLDLDIYYDALVSEEIYAGEILSSLKKIGKQTGDILVVNFKKMVKLANLSM